MKKILSIFMLLVAFTTGAWAETVNATLEHTASSSRNGSNAITTTVDQEYEHYNNTKAAAWGGWAYAHFSFSIPDGASISSATLTWNTKIGGNKGNRNNDVNYVTAGTTINYSTLTSTTNLNLACTFIKNDVVAGPTNRTQVVTDVTAAVADIAATQDYIIFKWTNNAAGADLFGMGSNEYKPTLVITYTTETLYTATFTANGGTIIPTVTIYSDAERKISVTNGTLSDKTTYYYTAKLEGYNDYNGSFTVDGANPSLNFTMTEKILCNFSVNAVDNEDNILVPSIYSNTCYAGETSTFYVPVCVLLNKILYFKASPENNRKTETVTSNNQVFSYDYSNNEVVNAVFFTEGEDLSGASVSTPTNNEQLASRGHMGRGSDLTVTTLGPGIYTIYVKYINTNASGHTVVVKAGDTDVINNTDVKARPTLSGSVTLTESATITLTASASSTSGVDYIYIVKTAEIANIPSSEIGTIASAYALDCSKLPNGVKAYKVSMVSANGATLEEVTTAVAPGTGLILRGTAGTYDIPVVAEGTDISSTNKLEAAVTATTLKDGTFYIMQGGQFHLVEGAADEAARTVPAGKAYLPVANGNGARSISLSFGEITGVSEVAAEAKAVADGKFIKNGQLVIEKNGKVFNANGAQVK